MGINKRVVGGLLGGGVTAVVASFGGIEAKKKIDYDGKVRYFGGLRTLFNDKLPTIGSGFDKNHYIPKWEDHERWKKVYETANKKIYNKTFDSYEKMRDACYEYVYTSSKKDFEDCSSSNSWCTSCTRDKNWDTPA